MGIQILNKNWSTRGGHGMGIQILNENYVPLSRANMLNFHSLLIIPFKLSLYTNKRSLKQLYINLFISQIALMKMGISYKFQSLSWSLFLWWHNDLPGIGSATE